MNNENTQGTPPDPSGLSVRAGSVDYETQLAEWKVKHGYSAPLVPGSTEEAEAIDAALRAADKKLTGEDYCVLCGKGPQPISGMEIITRMDDPYMQIDTMDDEEESDDELPGTENRVRACPTCWREEYGPEDDDSSQNGRDEPRRSEA